MSLLEDYIGKRISVVTCDARHLIGIINGTDQYINIVLTKCKELIHSEDGVTELEHQGAYLIRGDNVVLFGEIDEEVEKSLKKTGVQSKPLKPLFH